MSGTSLVSSFQKPRRSSSSNHLVGSGMKRRGPNLAASTKAFETRIGQGFTCLLPNERCPVIAQNMHNRHRSFVHKTDRLRVEGMKVDVGNRARLRHITGPF